MIFDRVKESEKNDVLRLYRSLLGTEYCVWTEDYPAEREIEFDLSRDALFCLLDTFSENNGNDLASTGSLLLMLSDMQKKPSESRTDIATLYFQKASEYIRNNYAYPIQISDVARYVGIDRSYLYRIFMEHENTSPKQYLLKHRLQMATQLLCSSSCTITEAALSCGFRDAPSFCNYFRQGTGYTPKEFRKIYGGTIYS